MVLFICSSAVPDDEPSVDDYTPPESGSVISSSSTSESITPILSTPQPTPRHSPTPSLEHALVSEEPSESTHVTIDLDTPAVTPTLQRREPKEEEFSEQDTITTPQVVWCVWIGNGRHKCMVTVRTFIYIYIYMYVCTYIWN